MTYGIIDVGSNTIRLNLYQYEQEKLSLLLSKKYNAGLAGHVNGGSLTPRGIQLAIDTLNACRDICENFRVEHVSVFATASLRNIVNTDEVIRILRAKTGYAVDLISGEEEARLDFLGATHALNIQAGVLVDIGGGSTELVRYREGKLEEAVSLPIGSLNLFCSYVKEGVLPTTSELRDIRDRAEDELEQVSSVLAGENPVLCGVGGTVRAVHKLSCRWFNHDPAECCVTADEIQMLYKRCKKADRALLMEILKSTPDRIHTLTPGLTVLRSVVRAAGGQVVHVSSFGIREGYLYDRVLPGASRTGKEL